MTWVRLYKKEKFSTTEKRHVQHNVKKLLVFVTDAKSCASGAAMESKRLFPVKTHAVVHVSSSYFG